MLNKHLLLFVVFICAFLTFGQTANFAGTPTVICVGQNVQFSDSSSGAITYEWIFPDGGAGQTSTLANPSITYPNAGVFDVTQIVFSLTTSDTLILPGYITVLSAASAVLSSGAGTDSQVVCTGTVLNTITYDVFGATNATFSSFPGFVSGSFTPNANGGVVTISGLPNPAGNYPYSFTTSGPSCTPITVNGTIIVAGNNTLSVSSGPPNQQVCLDSAITNISFNVNGSPTSVVATGLPPGIIGSWSGSTFTIAGAAASTGSFVYTITSSGGPCSQTQFSGSFYVDPHVELASAPGSINQTLCVGSPLGNIVYTLGPSITGTIATGLPPGITSSFTSGQFLITNSPTAAGVYNYSVTTSGSPCGNVVVNGTITVLELPTLTQDLAGIEIQTLCQTQAISDITYTVGGSATGATATGLPNGITGTFNSGVFTVSGTATEFGVFNFTVYTTGSSCGSPILTGTLTIDGPPQLVLTSPALTDSQEVCLNTSLNTLLYVLLGTATSVSIDSLPPGMTTTTQNDSTIIMGSPSTTGVFPFYVYSTGGLCPPDTAFCLLSVGNPPFINLASAVGTDGQLLCGGELMDSIIYVISGAADTAFATGLPTGVNAIFSGDSLIITGNPSTMGTTNYSVFGSGGLCPDATLNGSVSVFDPQIAIVSSAVTDTQTVCVNSAIVQIVYTYSGGATGANVVNLPGGVISSIQNDTLFITGAATTLGSYAFFIHTTGNSCDADTAFGLINVQSSAGLSLVSAVGSNVQTVNQNSAITTIIYLLSGTANNPLVTGLPSGVSAIVSSDSVIITGSPPNAGVFPYSITATGGTCPINNLAGTITVLQDTVIVVQPPLDSLELFIPNLFTPNADGYNDTWVISDLDQYNDTYVMIINREGQIVFEDFDYQNTWDGAFNGDPLPEATYYYLINLDAGEKIFKGAVSILRNE